MLNHVTKTVFQNSKILHFFGVKSEIYLYHHRSYYYRSVVLLFSTNTERIITNINYYVLFVSRTVLSPIRYITNKSYYRIDYNRFVLLLNISIPEKYHYRMVLLPNWVLPNCFITVGYYRMHHGTTGFYSPWISDDFRYVVNKPASYEKL